MPSHPLLLRFLLITLVACAIVIPLRMIAGKATERAQRAAEVTQRFASETAGHQAVAGPFLALTCEQAWEEERPAGRDGKVGTVRQKLRDECPTVFVAPRRLQADVAMPVETLRRGIYPIRTFRARVRLAGEFEVPPHPAQGGVITRRWKDAYVVMRIGEPRGLRAARSAHSSDLLATVAIAPLDAFTLRESRGEAAPPGTTQPFEYELDLAGTGSFQVLPVGDDTHIRLQSDWPHPSIAPRWLPETRAITDAGFEASWRVTRVATGGTPTWAQAIASGQLIAAPVQGAGVTLVEPVDIYALSYRATEYGFLFVLFTFAALALAEVLGGVRLHPVQYALVGCAIATFFLLLLALAEHVGFPRAYAIAAGACVALLVFYLRHPLGTWARTTAFLAIFAAMYGSLYVLLRLEDHALLVGAILVFAVLAAAMALTRRLDWGALALSRDRPSAAPGSDAPTAAS